MTLHPLKVGLGEIPDSAQLEPPTPPDRYRGCEYAVATTTLSDADDGIGRSLPGLLDQAKRWQNLPRVARAIEHRMFEFMVQSAESYVELEGSNCRSKGMARGIFRARASRTVGKAKELGKLGDKLNLNLLVFTGSSFATSNYCRTEKSDDTAQVKSPEI